MYAYVCERACSCVRVFTRICACLRVRVRVSIASSKSKLNVNLSVKYYTTSFLTQILTALH